jgi:hypothetical protein
MFTAHLRMRIMPQHPSHHSNLIFVSENDSGLTLLACLRNARTAACIVAVTLIICVTECERVIILEIIYVIRDASMLSFH